MSLHATPTVEAHEVLDAWFSAPFGDGEDAQMVQMLDDVDRVASFRAAKG